MFLKIAAVDDEREILSSLSKEVREWLHARGKQGKTEEYPSAAAFLFAYDADEGFDILLLDVEMPGMGGLALAKKLRERGCTAEMVFVTSHAELASEGYEVDALHYLVKPVKKEKLFEVLDKAAARLTGEPKSILIASEDGMARLRENEILYLEARLHEVKIVTKKGSMEVREPFRELLSRLSDDFYQTHRSYAVSLRATDKIVGDEAYLAGGSRVPVARTRKAGFIAAFIERR